MHLSDSEISLLVDILYDWDWRVASEDVGPVMLDNPLHGDMFRSILQRLCLENDFRKVGRAHYGSL